ncbi:MAG: hypothetical protein ACEPOW_13785 [Bacteroidales bacterium]
MTKIFEKYWIVVLVGVFFILTSIYDEFGQSKHVYWSIYIKTVRALFVLILLNKWRGVLPNVLSILSCLGGMAYFVGLTGFRFWSAYMSDGIYKDYFEYMKDDEISNYFTFGMFAIMAIVHFIAFPEPIIKYIIIPIKKLLPWKNGSQDI